jgi:flavin-dependent dehydrogenase
VEGAFTGKTESIDLLILGAGPAGLSTALHLLQSDPSWAGRMILLEKSAHPREKLCGGAISRLGLEVLQGLGLPLPLPIPHARVDDVRLKYGRRVVHVHGRPQLLVFHRAELDAYLAEQARQRGAILHENEAALTFDPQPEGVAVTTWRSAYQARAVVAADGSKGIVRRWLNRSQAHTRVARTLEVLLPADPSAPQFTGRYALFDFSLARQDLQGYYWDFPTSVAGEPRLNLGVYDARISPGRPRPYLPLLLAQAARAPGYGSDGFRPSGHPIHWFSPRNRFACPRVVLVGDAAGADPLFGEGIGPGLAYGKVAAQAIQQAFSSGDFSFQNYRRLLVRSYVGRYLMTRWVVAKIGYRLGGSALYMNLVWTIGAALARLWPAPHLKGF